MQAGFLLAYQKCTQCHTINYSVNTASFPFGERQAKTLLDLCGKRANIFFIAARCIIENLKMHP